MIASCTIDTVVNRTSGIGSMCVSLARRLVGARSFAAVAIGRDIARVVHAHPGSHSEAASSRRPCQRVGGTLEQRGPRRRHALTFSEHGWCRGHRGRRTAAPSPTDRGRRRAATRSTRRRPPNSHRVAWSDSPHPPGGERVGASTHDRRARFRAVAKGDELSIHRLRLRVATALAFEQPQLQEMALRLVTPRAGGRAFLLINRPATD